MSLLTILNGQGPLAPPPAAAPPTWSSATGACEAVTGTDTSVSDVAGETPDIGGGFHGKGRIQ